MDEAWKDRASYSKSGYLDRLLSTKPFKGGRTRRSLMKRLKINPGDRHGKLTIIEEVFGKRQRRFKCRCDCGNETIVRLGDLRSGNTKSCGCLKKERKPKNYSHGMSLSKEYKCWQHMKARCENPSNDGFSYYGKRGIKVCDRWKDSFENFYADMGPAPSPKHTIERINNEKDYSPENCKWATWFEQANNTRRNVKFFYNGKFLTPGQGARLLGIEYNDLYGWLKKNNMLIRKYSL